MTLTVCFHGAESTGKSVLADRLARAAGWPWVPEYGRAYAEAHGVPRALTDLAEALAIPERTLARRKREGQLSPEESAKLVRLARTVERAEEVFEDAAAALAWLRQDNAALGGVTPLSLLDTDLGADAVLDTLGRIEHGVFA